MEPEDVDDGQPHNARNLIAVAVEIVEGLKAARLQVAGHAVDHLAEVVVRDSETAYGVMECGPDGMIAEAAFERVFEFGSPALHGGAGGARLIAEVVTVAHEGVDGAHRLALLGAQQDERVVE